MIAFDSLVFDYPGHRALHGVSARIEAGSITALVGPNGAGKTTLMRCLAALEIPFSGSIRVDGIDVVAEPREARARTGFLQDMFGLYDELSARRCLHYAAATRGVPNSEIASRVGAVADRLGLSALLDHPAGALSRGQRQRLAIGQAIIHEFALLILDEPAAGLDPESRTELSGLLRQLRNGGMTLLVSSHILSELEDYSTHMLVLDEGRIVQHEAIQAFETSLRRLTVRFVGTGTAAEALLRARSGVSGLSVAEAEMSFDFAGDDQAQAELVAALVGAGLPLLSISEARASMQDIYLERVRSARAARA